MLEMCSNSTIIAPIKCATKPYNTECGVMRK